MKIKHKKILKPLIKLHFLKNQFYKQFIKAKCVNNVTLQLKQALKIIYLYKKKKKPILFLGFPYNKFVHNQINHIFISKNSYLKNKDNLNYKQFDLIVYNKTSNKDKQLLKTLENLNIPIVLFGDLNENGYNFNVLTKKKSIKNFNFFIIFSILTKYIK